MKTAAILLFAVVMSTSLFLQSSAAPDPLLDSLGALSSGLGAIVGDVGKTADAAFTGVGLVADETLGALLGKGGKTCIDCVLFLKDLGVVLKAAQERLYGLLTDVIKELDEAAANASGALKELLIKLIAPLKVLLEELPELLKAFVAAVANPTDEALNKVEAGLKKLEAIVAKLTEVLAEDTTGILPLLHKSLIIAVKNSFLDGFGAFKVVLKFLRRN